MKVAKCSPKLVEMFKNTAKDRKKPRFDQFNLALRLDRLADRLLANSGYKPVESDADDWLGNTLFRRDMAMFRRKELPIVKTYQPFSSI